MPPEPTNTQPAQQPAADPEPRDFLHLVPLETRPWGEGWLHCDLCYDAEFTDIIEAQNPWQATLRPMYRDTRDDCVICQKCAESGVYLNLEDGEQQEPSHAE